MRSQIVVRSHKGHFTKLISATCKVILYRYQFQNRDFDSLIKVIIFLSFSFLMSRDIHFSQLKKPNSLVEKGLTFAEQILCRFGGTFTETTALPVSNLAKTQPTAVIASCQFRVFQTLSNLIQKWKQLTFCDRAFSANVHPWFFCYPCELALTCVLPHF